MSRDKWIDGLTAATPAHVAARRVLWTRWERVRHYLPLALHAAADDPEHVHQLRVATRRARAALDIFSPWLPKESYRTARKFLRKLRRSAGPARDLDVFLGHLAQKVSTATGPGVAFLAGHALVHRAQAQAQLERTGRRFRAKRDRKFAAIPESVSAKGKDGKKPFQDWARDCLRAKVEALRDSIEPMPDTPAKLHQVRIAGKRLRYAMEVFASCFPAAFRTQVYPRVEELQEILGDANDSYTAGRRLEALAGQLPLAGRARVRLYRPGIEMIRRFHAQRLARARGRFARWRARWQRREEAKLLGLLGEAPKPARQAARTTNRRSRSASPNRNVR